VNDLELCQRVWLAPVILVLAILEHMELHLEELTAAVNPFVPLHLPYLDLRQLCDDMYSPVRSEFGSYSMFDARTLDAHSSSSRADVILALAI
jgi:hypothetical protein